MVKQVSVFLENRAGRIYDVCNLLGKNGINIRALSVADTSDFGILRLILDNPEKAINVLKEAKFTVSSTDVVAIEISDKPGGLAEILKIFDENSINVEYMYAFLAKIPEKAVLIFRFDNTEEIVEKLKKKNIKLISSEELYKL
ncbi:MAG: ACT domain-containing protein [Brevinematales bacterium]|nr:ACT domain-containing protein [Brevinematales bacterium]